MDKKTNSNEETITITLTGDEVLTDFFDLDDGVMGDDDQPDSEKEVIIKRI